MSGPSAFPELGEWLQGHGRDADISLCTRVRLARNVQGYRFAPKLLDDEASTLDAYLREHVRNVGPDGPLEVVDVDSIESIERQVLIERHLISRELATAKRSRSVAFDAAESLAIMINEEDHLRIQAFRSGFEVEGALDEACRVDDTLVRDVPFAFSEEFGFLTSCPTNTGTGLRISVMLHLPGLVWAEEIEKASNTAQKIHLAVRGLYGEGSRAIGDFYQVSNQVTLGRSEEEIRTDVHDAVEKLVEWERKVRAALLEGESRARTLDRVFRAYGVLRNAHVLTSDECLGSLSAVRFGVERGLFEGQVERPPTVRDLNNILLQAQPGHLQRIAQRPLEAAERDLQRAELVRGILTRPSDAAPD